jgi:thiol:disulfide interchange protein DsbD
VKLLRAFLLAAMLGANLAQAAHTQVELFLDASAAKPGDTVMAGLRLRMDPRWHTYWRNPGASGTATRIVWDLPPGVTAGAVQWPAPWKMPEEDLTTYVFTNEATLLVPLKLASTVLAGPLEIRANVSWLECDQQCVPGEQAVQASLTVAGEPKSSTNAALLQKWRESLPADGASLKPEAWWSNAPAGKLRTVILQYSTSEGTSAADFYPGASDTYEVQADTGRVAAAAGKQGLTKVIKKFSGDWPARLTGLLVQETPKGRVAYEIDVPIQASAPATLGKPDAGDAGAGPARPRAAPLSARSTGDEPSPPLLKMLLYAFLGGLILNIMPCVLPVIALKILGFVGQAKSAPAQVRKLGLVYALGVLVSFWALAAVVIGVQAAGRGAGWGMQFGNPIFLVGITVLVTLVALNLFGVFEITLGGNVMDSAGTLSSKHGASGAFFNGVLATVLATPCTAPFLGAALGFAFTQPAAIILLVFSMAALGLAAPYVVLSWNPSWLKFLPKPGLWMQRFKVAIGFPMLLTAVWLLSVAHAHYGTDLFWLVAFLVVVALAAWVYGEFVQRGASRRGLASLIVLALLAGGYAYLLEQQLHWRMPRAESAATSAPSHTAEGIDWQPWSAESVAKAQAEGRVVFVDFTADWCLTCQVNKKVAIEIPEVRARLKQLNAVTFLGDYTKTPPAITAELKRYGRAGVPLVLAYPGKPGAQPIVLPEVLTTSLVLSALQKAAQPEM